jgi:hypothetical protein
MAGRIWILVGVFTLRPLEREVTIGVTKAYVDCRTSSQCVAGLWGHEEAPHQAWN